jgi:hypothetical protein
MPKTMSTILRTGRLTAAVTFLGAMCCTAFADVLKPDFVIMAISGPTSLPAGLSGTYTVTIQNVGNAPGPLEAHIGFSGVIDQTDQIRAGNGLSCAIEDGTPFNANQVVHCTGATLQQMDHVTIVVQGRAQTAGEGRVWVQLNYNDITPELYDGGNYSSLPIKVN